MIGKASLIPAITWLALAFSSGAYAQFGGRAGDVVIYAVSYNGSGDFQVAPSTATNSAQSANAFHVTVLKTVPESFSDPFPLVRRVLYMTDKETFQIGTDFENTIGLHRLNVFPVRILQLEGVINITGQLLGASNTFIRLPQGLDDGGDLSLLDVVISTWFPGAWPFIVPTNQQGPFPCPAGTSGFTCFIQVPGAISLPSLIPWTGLSTIYPGAGWQQGIDLKLMEADPNLGDTIRQIRLRPGKKTPMFRIPGHTHLFILQGSVTITPAGSAPIVMNKYDYAFLPESFAVTLSNPEQYNGPGAP